MEQDKETKMERRKVPVTKVADGDPFFSKVVESSQKIEKRAYEFFLERNGEHGNHAQDWFKAETELFRAVACELADKGNELMIRAEVPGFNERDLEVKVDVDRIFVTGHKERTVQSSAEGRILSDRQCKDIFRMIPLPLRVDPHLVSTMLHEGILTIFVRKAVPAETKVKGQAA
jgi:HSP20 family protein